MIQGLTNKQDIKVIHSIVSDELKAQIEKAFPELFGPKQHDFSDAGFNGHLPFFVGSGLCDHKDDRNKCLLVHSCYKAEVELQDNGYQIIRFFYQKQYDFTEFIDLFNKHDLPFTVGKKLCTKNEDMNKCLIVYSCYTAEVELQDNGYQIIRFFEKKS